MTKVNRKHFGPATKGKGDGSGGTTDLQEGLVGENAVLTNRDKSQHGGDRGADSKWVETEQLRDHAANREPD